MSHTCMNHNGDPAYCEACREEHERSAQEERDREAPPPDLSENGFQFTPWQLAQARREAYRAGAEAMREAAAKVARRWEETSKPNHVATSACSLVAGEISALLVPPMPEDAK